MVDDVHTYIDILLLRYVRQLGTDLERLRMGDESSRFASSLRDSCWSKQADAQLTRIAGNEKRALIVTNVVTGSGAYGSMYDLYSKQKHDIVLICITACARQEAHVSLRRPMDNFFGFFPMHIR